LGLALPGWVFRLDFEIGEVSHAVERSSDGRTILLNGEAIPQNRLRDFLNDSGVFDLTGAPSPLSFRALFKRFARLKQADCEHPDSTSAETPYAALVATLFLLGLDVTLASHKNKHKQTLDDLKKAKRIWRDTPELQELFRGGTDARVRANWLKEKIPRIRADLEGLVIAENYAHLEQAANEMTRELRELESEIEVYKFQVKGITEQLQRTPDISSNEMLGLYSGLEEAFKPEMLRHFNAVEAFHRSLTENRKRRLSSELLEIQANILEKDQARARVAKERDRSLRILEGKTALEEYRSVANDLAAKEQELQMLEDYLHMEARVSEEILLLQEIMSTESLLANQYVASEPLKDLERRYRALTGKLYPHAASGITLENNTNANTIRYDLKVHLEADGSDGVRDAKILCFDWLVFHHGSNHLMKFLWHDNRLFAHLDPGVRARWFSSVLDSLKESGMQYVAAINFENFDSMSNELSSDERVALQAATIMELRGDSPMQKLLGIQVDI